MIFTLSIVMVVASLLLIVLVLLHRGKGGGLSSMLGGSFYSSLSGSSGVERNLDRLTIIAGAVWAISIIGLGLLNKNQGPSRSVYNEGDPRGRWQCHPRQPGRRRADG